MKRTKIIIISCIIIGLICIISLSVIKKQHSKNDPSEIGNWGGNLNNGGLFCEKDGTVYFSNPMDGGTLYSMGVDESKPKQISKSPAKSINVDSNHIYYSLSSESNGTGLGYIRKSTGMYRVDLDGTHPFAYTQDPVGIIALSGNNLYYQHYTDTTGTDIDCITIDKKDNHTVIENMVSPASVYGGKIYYSGASEDLYLYTFDTTSEMSSLLYDRPMYNPIYLDGYVYYIDLETNYELHKYSLMSGEDFTLTKDRVDCFNVLGSMIYYQKDSSAADAALLRMDTDGNNVEVVATGIYCDINMTSQYVYFHPYDSRIPTYQTPVYGSVYVTEFNP